MNYPTSQYWLKAMQQGQQHYQHGMLNEALRMFMAATQISPVKAEGWVNLGIIQIETGQLEDALSSLKRAVDLNPRLMSAHLAMGEALRLVGKWEESISAFNKAIALQRTPEGLNKLACVLRAVRKPEAAEALYKEALRMNPKFTLAKVNLATVQVELEYFDQANQQLQVLEKEQLSAEERYELESTKTALNQYLRVKPAMEAVMSKNDPAALYETLMATPKSQLRVDEEIIEGIQRYADSAKHLPISNYEEHLQLPEEWPLIEALFMIPYVESVSEYRKIKARLSSAVKPEGDLLESINMEAVVVAAGDARHDLSDPIKAEMHLRHWHALATEGVANILPGQFKMTQNLVNGHQYRRRAKPHLVTGTIRQFFKEIYNELPPGLPRGLVTMMAISDIHPFADGNGRIAQVFLNRELAWENQMPVLFTREVGIAGGEFTAATRKMRLNTGTIFDVVSVVQKGQQFARNFCADLNGS